MIRALLLFFLLHTNWGFCQTKDTITVAYRSVQNYEMEAFLIKNRVSPSKQDFQGSYHFGDSEAESQLDILFSNNKLYARVEYADWESETWTLKSDRLDISFLSGKVIVDKIQYQLASSNNEKGLVSHSYNNEADKIIHYIQFNPDGLLEKPKGQFPETGFVKLNSKDLNRFSKHELKLMRNELFARQGYLFKKGGEMETYFLKQDWYVSIPKTKNIEFNIIEAHNLSLIKTLEQVRINQKEELLNNKSAFRDTLLINYKQHKELLNILKLVPEYTMDSWEWSKQDRVKTIGFIEQHNSIIDSTQFFYNIKYIKPNTIGIQVVDGFWTLSIYQYNENNYFVVTNDIVGDFNDIRTFNYINNKLTPTKMENWFSDFKYKLLLNNSKKCTELIDEAFLSFKYNFTNKTNIYISSDELGDRNCFKGNNINYQLNKEAKTFNVVSIDWQ